MDHKDRDRLLESVWGLDPFADNVAAIATAAAALGSADPGPVAPLAEPLRALAERQAAKSRARGGGATTGPGQAVLEREPGALRQLAAELAGGSILVAGTNGKTTTARMLATILRQDGRSVVHNRAGANVPAGVATAMLAQRGEVGVFEVDEAWVPLVAAELDPGLILLGNLFRDRLDGYGELEAIASSWREMVIRSTRTRFVANADDPLVASIVACPPDDGGPTPLFYGIEDRRLDLSGAEEAADSTYCRACGSPLRFEARFLSHLGHYRCSACAAGRPAPAIGVDEVEIEGLAGSRFSLSSEGRRTDLSLSVPGLHSVYNAAAATAAALAAGASPAAVAAALAAYSPAFGRGERIRADGTEVLILLMKNPAGANEMLRTLLGDGAPEIDLLVALNDGGADGRDVSWIWDADFELLRDRAGSVVCGGTRAAEIALRLKYAGWDPDRLLVEPAIPRALDLGISLARGRLVAVPTYSALLELHAELAKRGLAAPFWAE